MHVFVALLLLSVISIVAPVSYGRSFDEFFEEMSDHVDHVYESIDKRVEEQNKMFGDIFNNYDYTHKYDLFDEDYMEPKVNEPYFPGGDINYLDSPNVGLSVPEIITRNGYVCETQKILSQGYVLNIHRIPHSRNGSGVPSKTVLLQHGILGSSSNWILNGPGKGLAYVLADAGYDVWMTNIRGNMYSKDHIKFKPNSEAYWDFSWHDVALYDIPEIIDYILTTKGIHTKITYIGHSMGTTILYAMLTLRPEYNDILTAGFAFAPEIFLSNMKSPIKFVTPIIRNLAYKDKLRGIYEFMPKNSVWGRLTSLCNVGKFASMVCKNIIFFLCGFDRRQFNDALLPEFLMHSGTGTSWKTVVHFTQVVISGKFQQFDYGYLNNVRIYGATSPPEYDLSKVTLPTKLFFSKNDLLCSEKDVRKLYWKLHKKPEMYLVPDEMFNHLDYLMAMDAPRLLNNEVLDSLHTYMDN